MSQRGKALLHELLALPAIERQSIAEDLLLSLTDDENELAIEQELNRRWQEVVTKKVKLLPRSVLRKTK